LFINGGDNPGLGGNELLCGHTEFEKSGNGLGEAKAKRDRLSQRNDKNQDFGRKDELFEPQILVISITLGMFLEGLVSDENVVGAKKINNNSIRY